MVPPVVSVELLAVPTDASVADLIMDQDKDGVFGNTDKVESEPMVVMERPVTVLTDEKVRVVVGQQVKAIKKHKKAVDKVDNDIQVIQQEMKQQRAVDLESLAKHRHWATKPQGGDDLYKEWKADRAKRMAPATPFEGPR